MLFRTTFPGFLNNVLGHAITRDCLVVISVLLPVLGAALQSAEYALWLEERAMTRP